MEYNDNLILSPNEYKTIAENYAKANTLNFRVIKVDTSKENKDRAQNDINDIYNELYYQYIYLTKYKRSQKENISKLEAELENIKNSLTFLTEQSKTSFEYKNYCDSLKKSICISTKFVKALTKYCVFVNEAESEKIDSTICYLLETIDTFTNMFGECKFRQ